MKQVFQAHDVIEAHLIKGLLESQGLTALVRGEAVAGLAGEVHASGPAKSVAAGAGWRCPKCAQDIEPQFTACWACGTERT